MPFIPHTDSEIRQMLIALGVTQLDALFDEIPKSISEANIDSIPEGMNEMQVARLMQDRFAGTGTLANYLGAGAYEHYIPAAVWQLVGRGEFYTAYTPYQAEASQGSLQLIYEYQTMISELMQMDVANASLYEGASAVAESALMAVRIHKHKKHKIIVPTSLNPAYRRVLTAMLANQDIELITLAFDQQTGVVATSSLEGINPEQVAAIIIPQPNFFGTLEACDELTNWAHQQKMLVIAVVNPLAMALLQPPGEWGEQGADIVCGEGQPLGVPLSYGGPYFGFMCCKKEYIRNMPGRIVGRTKDEQGREGYVLTLQAREQHIRRAKATSNICTNQGLLVVAATLYLSLLGSEGLREAAVASHIKARYLAEKLAKLPGVELVFNSPFWHEFVIKLPCPVARVQTAMREKGIECGYNLEMDYPGLNHALLVCVTETKTEQDLDAYVKTMQKVLMTLLTTRENSVRSNGNV